MGCHSPSGALHHDRTGTHSCNTCFVFVSLTNLKHHKCHSWPYFATVTFDQVCISVFHCIGNVKLWCNCMYTWFECLIVCLDPHECISVNTCTQLPAQNIHPFFKYTILLECTTVCTGLCLLMQSSSHSV